MSSTGDARGRAIGLFLFALFLIAAMEAAAKALSASFPVLQIVWARYVFHLLFILPLIAHHGIARTLRTRHPVGQITRSFFLLGMTGLLFYAIRKVPLADATSILFLAPLMVTALSAVWLQEHVGPRRWVAVAIGFVGAMIILRPGASVFSVGAVPLLGAAVCLAMYQVLTRVVSQIDPPMTTLTYTGGIGILLSSFALPFGWQTPDLYGWLALAGVGALGAAGQYAFIRVYERVPASALAPFGYIHLLWATGFGFLLFGNLPDRWTVLGAAVISGSGLYVYHRESVSRRRQTAVEADG